jgi:hypothetical protein
MSHARDSFFHIFWRARVYWPLLCLCSALRDIWIRTQRAAVASRRATNLATHLHTIQRNTEIIILNLTLKLKN